MTCYTVRDWERETRESIAKVASALPRAGEAAEGARKVAADIARRCRVDPDQLEALRKAIGAIAQPTEARPPEPKAGGETASAR